ncbi:MAG: dTMP kinase [Candidatus Sericytochromatia bacterium]|nr:dTMP kinase [Candidatus Sericytochromatia bacterium]
MTESGNTSVPRGGPGRFVTFEGGEGAGKTTLIRALAAVLARSGREVVVTREPGGTLLGGEIRELLLSPGQHVDAVAELLLYGADRAQHLGEVVRPALARGAWVLCDRHVDSLVAYQAFGRGLDRAMVEQVNAWATGGLVPDRTLWLDVPVTEGLRRAGRTRGPDRLEAAGVAFHERVREGFALLAREHAGRFIRLDGTRAPDEVLADARMALADLV